MSDKHDKEPRQSQSIVGSGKIVSQNIDNTSSNMGAQGIFSGPVNIYSGGGNVGASKKQQLFEKLDDLKQQFHRAAESGLEYEIIEDSTIELIAAERELKREHPNADRAKKRLNNVYDIVEPTTINTLWPGFQPTLADIITTIDTFFAKDESAS